MARFLAASTVALGAACLAALFAASSRANAEDCARAGYSHVGVARRAPTAGVAATVTALRPASVRSGHVAAWVGVGDRATRNWLQVGVVAYPGRSARVYVEAARASSPRSYVELGRALEPGLRLAVVAVRPGSWQAYAGGQPVGEPVVFDGETGAPAYATTESWSAGGAPCNRFAYRFDGVGFADARGDWSNDGTTPLRAPSSRLDRIGAAGFLAVAS